MTDPWAAAAAIGKRLSAELQTTDATMAMISGRFAESLRRTLNPAWPYVEFGDMAIIVYPRGHSPIGGQEIPVPAADLESYRRWRAEQGL